MTRKSKTFQNCIHVRVCLGNPLPFPNYPLSHMDIVNIYIYIYIYIYIHLVHPMCLTYPTVPCRTGGILLWNPMCPTDSLYPVCLSYPTHNTHTPHTHTHTHTTHTHTHTPHTHTYHTHKCILQINQK